MAAAGRVDDGPSVVEALRDGDADALSELYDRWSPLVYSLALRSVGDVAAAEDVTKRVFTQLWTQRGTFDPARSSFSAWLVELACARIAEVEQAGPPTASGGVGNVEKLSEGESGSMALAERLLLADELAHLDPEPQRVLRLVLDDVSPAEVAERTGMSVEDVKSQVASSLVQLRQRWEVSTDAH